MARLRVLSLFYLAELDNDPGRCCLPFFATVYELTMQRIHRIAHRHIGVFMRSRGIRIVGDHNLATACLHPRMDVKTETPIVCPRGLDTHLASEDALSCS